MDQQPELVSTVMCRVFYLTCHLNFQNLKLVSDEKKGSVISLKDVLWAGRINEAIE